MRTVRLSSMLDGRAESTSTLPNEQPEDVQHVGNGAVAEALESTRPGARRAAIFVLSLEEEVASRLLRCLDDDELAVIASEIAGLGLIEKETVNGVLREFHELKDLQDIVSQRGLRAAAHVAKETFPAEKAQRITCLLRETRQSVPLASLDDVDLEHLAVCLRKEHPQTRAVVLAHMPPARAATLLKGLAPKEREGLLERIDALRNVRAEVLRRLEGALRSDLGEADTDDEGLRSSASRKARALPAGEGSGGHEDGGDDQTARIEARRKPTGTSLSTFESMLDRSTTEELDGVVASVSIEDLARALRGLPRELQGRVFARLQSYERESFCRAAEKDADVAEEDVALARAEVARVLAESTKGELSLTSTSDQRTRVPRR